MKREIVYLKEVDTYNDILKKEHNRLPLIFKKIIFLFKNIFNLVTKKQVEGANIWILPIKERYCMDKLEKIFKKNLVCTENIYVISNELEKNKIYKCMDILRIEYLTEEKIKKILLINILKYISKIQKKDISSIELSILVNKASEINLFLIEELCKLVKNVKIISLNIHKFKSLEEKLYNEYGIAIQFSNSYKKSLEKSKIIINLDFSDIEINEYKIFDYAIIISCITDNIKIKSKLFNGLIINSWEINFRKEIIDKLKKEQIYSNFRKLILYASIIENEKDISKIFEIIELDKVRITNLIGNNGYINKKEIKNIDKSLDKNLKKE